ncbi:MAG: aspartyl protease family protein [Planctomycetes bacterium]|nr:aspartyl protease family protein [Planctomycetota bacterium]
MKLLIAFLVCLGAAAALFAQQSSFDVVGALMRGKVETPDYRAKLPFETFTSLIRVQAKVGGRECRMVFDTGAPMVITPELAKELGATVLGKYETKDAAGNSEPRDFVLLPTVDLGGARFSDLAAIVVDLHALAEFREQAIDGLIGGNLLRHGAVAIDYAAKTLEFAPSASAFDTKGWLEVPFGFSLQALPILALTVGEARVEHVELDTGANVFLELPAELVERVGAVKCLDVHGSATAGAFGLSPGGEKLCWMKGLTLASSPIPDMVVSSIPSGPAKVGNRFFERTKLVLDWPAKKLFVADPKLLGRVALRTHGLAVRHVDGEVRVATVLAGSRAERAKFAPGERVLAIDEFDLADGSLAKFALAADRLRDETRESTVVTVERDGAFVMLQLRREQALP